MKILVLLLFLTGCAITKIHPDEQTTTYNENTEYSIKMDDKGFKIRVYYSRFQLAPNTHILRNDCRHALTSIANEQASTLGKNIQLINEKSILISTARNGFTRVSTCYATILVKFQKESKKKDK